jgi:DNA-binding Lrp family transcriptional regulator
MLQKDTMYLICSSAPQSARRILSEKLSLLFGKFEDFEMRPFSFEVAKACIEEKLVLWQVPQGIKNFLISLTDGHPFYIQVLCKATDAERETHLLEDLTPNVVQRALRRELFDASGTLNQYFLNKIAIWSQPGSRGNQLSILVSLASGQTKIADLAETIRKSQRETTRQLKDLLDAEIITKNGVFYVLNDPVFRFWLKCVYRHREMSLWVDHDSKLNQFNQECEKAMSEFNEDAAHPESERIMDLFHRFSNEIVEFDSRGRRLPQFNKVEMIALKSNEKHAPLLATGDRVKWVCDVLKDTADESMVEEFIKASKQSKCKQAKKILITLSGMDANAKLLAKNTQIWTLNLKKINKLMEFYGKSKIVYYRKEMQQPASVPANPNFLVHESA